MKSISTYIAEAAAKVEQAYKAEDRYNELSAQMTEENFLETSPKVVEAYDAKMKALRQALKAVKGLYELFELEAPKLRFLRDAKSGLGNISYRWECMNEVFNY